MISIMQRMQRTQRTFFTLLCLGLGLGLGAPALALADEGMWTFNNFPSEAVARKYGFSPTQQWLDRARLASARLAGGCSGSFVSERGLVMTNHHCAHSCIEQLSDAKRDYVASGFYAATEKDEVKCPEIEINQLTAITDVTARLLAATKGLSGEQFATALKGEMAKVEQECATADNVRCDVVTLYRGGQYHLYRYRRFQDVRLAFAPELDIAFFGGDPDNFNFPRYDLDLAFLRVYENGAPAKMENFFKWSAAGAKEGELTFITGHPGATSRLFTVAQLEFERDYLLPFRLMYLAELRGRLLEFMHRGPEQKRVATSPLFSVENSFKALKGHREALLDRPFFQSKVDAENELKRKIAADPRRKKAYGEAHAAIARAVEAMRGLSEQYWYLEGTKERAAGFQGDLFAIARKLVRTAEEREKPNEQRLREYVDSNLPSVKQRIFSSAPIHDELEVALLSFSLEKLREELGVDDPIVKKVLGKESPQDLARAVVAGTKLKDVAVRQKLLDGGAAAVRASTDPMIQLVLRMDGDARAVRARYESEVDGVEKKNMELLSRARFEIYGTSQYPDATFTLRLTYGAVQGYQENGRTVHPFTTIGGAFDRHTGKDPYALPESWLKAKDALDLKLPFNFCTTNDIIGGNSGSPIINKDLEVVGLVFDGNIQSLGGDYGFDASSNRAVGVHSAAITEALEKVYRADRLLQELRATRAAAASPAGKASGIR
jgi:V8-like Glu-specific endopeptidase